MITGKSIYKRLTPEEKEVRKKTGANIRKLRSQAGYTQQRVEELLKMTLGTLSSIERGEAPINDNFLTEFCKLLHTTKDTVIWKPREKNDDNLLKAVTANELIHQNDNLDADTKERVEEMEAREQELLDKIEWLENEAAHADYEKELLQKVINQQNELINVLKRTLDAQTLVLKFMNEPAKQERR